MHANANEAVSEATENPEEAAARAALGHTLKRVGPFHPTTMQTLDSLANILQSQNKMEEAEHLRRQADRVVRGGPRVKETADGRESGWSSSSWRSRSQRRS